MHTYTIFLIVWFCHECCPPVFLCKTLDSFIHFYTKNGRHRTMTIWKTNKKIIQNKNKLFTVTTAGTSAVFNLADFYARCPSRCNPQGICVSSQEGRLVRKMFKLLHHRKQIFSILLFAYWSACFVALAVVLFLSFLLYERDDEVVLFP